MEGYGATETAPIMGVNSPMYFKRGSVGRLLPGIEYQLESIPGVEDGGKLLVKGTFVTFWVTFVTPKKKLLNKRKILLNSIL